MPLSQAKNKLRFEKANCEAGPCYFKIQAARQSTPLSVWILDRTIFCRAVSKNHGQCYSEIQNVFHNSMVSPRLSFPNIILPYKVHIILHISIPSSPVFTHLPIRVDIIRRSYHKIIWILPLGKSPMRLSSYGITAHVHSHLHI